MDGSSLAAGQTFASRQEAYAFEIPESVSGVDPKRYIVSHYPHQWKPYTLDDIVRELASALSGRLKKWDAGMPLVRGTGVPVEWPDQVL